MNGAEKLGLLGAHCVGVERHGWLHGDHGEELEQMVRHHVAQGACSVVELAPGLDAYRLGRGDLHVTDMVSVPERLEDAVGKAQHQDVLHRLLAEEMIDPIDLVFAQNFQDLRIERPRRSQVMAERLFDDHAAPGAVGLAGQVGAAEMLDDGPEELVSHGQIEQHVAVALLGALLRKQGLQPAVDLGLGEIPSEKCHASRKPVPGLLDRCHRPGTRRRHRQRAIASFAAARYARTACRYRHDRRRRSRSHRPTVPLAPDCRGRA